MSKVRLTPEDPEGELLEILAQALDAASAALQVADPADAAPPGPRATAFCAVAERLEDAVWLAAEAAAAANRAVVQRLRAQGWVGCGICFNYFPKEEVEKIVYSAEKPSKGEAERTWFRCFQCRDKEARDE